MTEIPFKENDWLSFVNEPSKKGQYTGKFSKMGKTHFIEIRMPNGELTRKPLHTLELLIGKKQIIDNLMEFRFGGLNDFRRCITFEKLKGSLHEVLYSMEAAQIDFFPYQFKPVLKFINSPTDRLILADEVGLGKTIEATLIWLELQARRNAKRLLVVCPGILVDKWLNELRYKFMIDARVAKFDDLKKEIEEIKSLGSEHAFTLIATYSGLRPPKNELRELKKSEIDSKRVNTRTAFLHSIRHWNDQVAPFDLIIFDEAHYMRNPSTSAFHLGESLSAGADAVLCVSATPVNNNNVDLHSLLRLVDDDFFETQEQFSNLLKANRPAVEALKLLSKKNIDIDHLYRIIECMEDNPGISASPIFQNVKKMMINPNIYEKSFIINLQENIEKLNILGNYITRTRRAQVTERRPIRDPKTILVEYKNEERKIYKTILSFVRKKCLVEKRPFHNFKLFGLQLRAASCLPVIAKEIKYGIHDDMDDLITEAFSFGDREDWEGRIENNIFSDLTIDNYDFEKNDSKYEALIDMLRKTNSSDKIVIFTYYRSTLIYLSKRLKTDGYENCVIHGGIDNATRWDAINKFADSENIKILLSSEVGSEGIDLQFCRIIINYDLPWNPMRVEQRIGRIDRIGQKNKKIVIFNFKVKDTIEERIYDRLHSKLAIFSSCLGDFEEIIGDEIKKLTANLLSKDLTKEQEIDLIEQTERAIEHKINIVNNLEESGDTLVALSDYVQKKIQEMKDARRYITPIELEDYVIDFFQREFQGCEILKDHPVKGCMNLKFTQEAYQSLNEFMANDKSLMAKVLRSKTLIITFDRGVKQNREYLKKKIVFITHLSPLIKWITYRNSLQENIFYNVCAIKCRNKLLPSGVYCFLIERWKFVGISKKEHLSYAIKHIREEKYIQDAENIINNILRNSETYTYINLNKNELKEAFFSLEKKQSIMFGEKYESFCNDNKNIFEIKKVRIDNYYDKKILSSSQALKTMQENKRTEKMINLARQRIEFEKQNRKKKIDELKRRTSPDSEQTQILAGVIFADE